MLNRSPNSLSGIDLTEVSLSSADWEFLQLVNFLDTGTSAVEKVTVGY